MSARKRGKPVAMTLPGVLGTVLGDANDGTGALCKHCGQSLADRSTRCAMLGIAVRSDPSDDPEHGPLVVEAELRCGACGETSGLVFSFKPVSNRELAALVARQVGFERGDADAE